MQRRSSVSMAGKVFAVTTLFVAASQSYGIPSFGTSGVVNVDATQSGISMANGQFTGSTLISPTQVSFAAGSYSASITSPVASPLQASYSGWSYNVNTPLTPTYLENVAAFNDATSNPVSTAPVFYFQSSNFYYTSALALSDAVLQGTFTFNLPTAETLDFVVPDNFLSDNSGGVSIAITKLNQAVPEPVSGAILAVGAVALLGSRRNRSPQKGPTAL